MGLFDSISSAVRALLNGRLADGDPERAALPSAYANVPGRKRVLDAFGAYIESLTFYRSGGEGKPVVPFHVTFYPEQPENETELKLPSIGVVPARGEMIPAGFAPTLLEETRDRYGKGTVVRRLATEWTERLQFEIWAGSKAERAAVITGLEAGLAPLEGVFGLRLRVPRYFHQTVIFTPLAVTIDESQAEKNRRKALIEVEMRYELVHLVRYTTLRPQVVVDVADHDEPFDDGSIEVELRTNP